MCAQSIKLSFILAQLITCKQMVSLIGQFRLLKICLDVVYLIWRGQWKNICHWRSLHTAIAINQHSDGTLKSTLLKEVSIFETLGWCQWEEASWTWTGSASSRQDPTGQRASSYCTKQTEKLCRRKKERLGISGRWSCKSFPHSRSEKVWNSRKVEPKICRALWDSRTSWKGGLQTCFTTIFG